MQLHTILNTIYDVTEKTFNYILFPVFIARNITGWGGYRGNSINPIHCNLGKEVSFSD